MTQSHVLLFDFDGTLADSIPAVHRATNETLEEHGFSSLDRASILYGMQFETVKRFEYHSGESAPERLEELRRLYYERLAALSEMIEPYPGTVELVTRLSQERFRIAIVSNNEGRLIRTVLNRWKATNLFEFVLGEEDFSPRKPHPAGITKARSRLETSPLATAYVGDSDSDAKAARDAGVYSLGVTWSHHKYHLAPSPWFPRTVDTVEELGERIRRWGSLVGSLPAQLLSGALRKRIYVVRHCESEANRRGILAAREDYPLSERGFRQAAAVAEAFTADHRVDRIVSSPLSRAWQTASAIGDAAGVGVERADALMEHQLGVFTGMSKEAIAARGDYPEEKSGRWRWRPEGGETYEEIYERVVAFLLREILGGPGESILLASHAVTMRMIRAFFENSAPLYPEPIAKNGEIWEIRFHGVGTVSEIREIEPPAV